MRPKPEAECLGDLLHLEVEVIPNNSNRKLTAKSTIQVRFRSSLLESRSVRTEGLQGEEPRRYPRESPGPPRDGSLPTCTRAGTAHQKSSSPQTTTTSQLTSGPPAAPSPKPSGTPTHTPIASRTSSSRAGRATLSHQLPAPPRPQTRSTPTALQSTQQMTQGTSERMTSSPKSSGYSAPMLLTHPLWT